MIIATAVIFTSVSVILFRQLWVMLDELLRNIWIEATSLTCVIMLFGAMLLSLLTSLGFAGDLSILDGIIIYNYLYMAVYFGITYARAPATFTNPTLEGE